MIWLTWRQHRFHALVGAGVLVLLVPFLVMTGRHLAELAPSAATCTGDCQDVIGPFVDYLQRSGVLTLLPLLPLLVGVFVGAPLLARELEQRTHLLCWTQGISRWRWLAVELGLLAGLTLLAFAFVDALMTWWSGPVDTVIGPWPTFDVRGITPFAYALFALVLGIAAGTLIRQTVAAMATTLAVFTVTRLAVATWLRPSYLPPLRSTLLQAVVTCNNPPTCNELGTTLLLGSDPYQRAWVLNQYPIGPLGPANSTVHFLTLYQPADRFWLFQGIESAVFVALAAALLGLTIWWVQRRLS